MNKSFIIGIGTANPETKLTQTKLAQHMATMLSLDEQKTKKLISVYEKSMIQYRHIIFDLHDTKIPYATTAKRMEIYERNACDLAIKAIKNAISENYLAKITHLITVSCTGMYAPGIDIQLINHLKLSSSIERTCVNFMGCYGVFNALKLANNICQLDKNAYVLVVSVELCSIHIQPLDQADKLIANAIFGDGAACALISSRPEAGDNFLIEQFHCDLAADEHQAMTWFIRDAGFDIHLSEDIPYILSKKIKQLTERLLMKLQLTINDINFFAIHPGGKKILSAVENALVINSEKNKAAHEVLRDYGNMSSATILFILKKILEDVAAENHQNNILAIAFGPGLTMESALLKVYRA